MLAFTPRYRREKERKYEREREKEKGKREHATLVHAFVADSRSRGASRVDASHPIGIHLRLLKFEKFHRANNVIIYDCIKLSLIRIL